MVEYYFAVLFKIKFLSGYGFWYLNGLENR